MVKTLGKKNCWNKKGWVKVLEVFVSIMMVTSIVVLLITQSYSEKNLSKEISSMEISILREVQLNESLRGEIIDATLPVNWSEFESKGLTDVKNLITEKKIASLECEAKICETNDLCKPDEETEKDIYSEKAMIAADLNTYSPRQLKIFCWEK